MVRLAVIILVALATLWGASAELKLQSVERRIDLTSQFARITESVKIKNTGDLAVDRVTLCHVRHAEAATAFQKVTQQVASKSVKVKVSLAAATTGAPAAAVCWEVTLKEQLTAGQVTSLNALTVYAGAQTAYPREISQGEQQKMVYEDSVHILSPYQVSTQTTEVLLPNGQVESYTDTEQPVSKSGSKIKYGKYDLIKPWTLVPLKVHFENDKPFKQAVSCVREIEVSHWGNIYVEESYEVTNAGAGHKGAFSRLKYAHTHNGRGNSFQDLRARLPAPAHSLYYVDLIGNISTSTVRKTSSETILEFLTRYPLMGGWKADFKIGYSVGLKGFLSVLRGGRRRLTMDLNSPLEGVYVKDLTVKVVLPEGSKGIVSTTPYGVEVAHSVKYTYLDVSGRPVVVMHKTNLVPEHTASFTIDYSFPSYNVLREPLMLVAAFAAFFLAVIGYNRMDFTITRTEKWQAQQAAEQMATAMQTLNSTLEGQDELLDRLAKCALSVRSIEDADHQAKQRAELEAAFATLDTQATSQLASVSASQPAVGSKVSALLERLRALKQGYAKLVTDCCDLVRKGASGTEANKKLQPAVAALAAQRKELADAVSEVFAPY